MAHFWANLLIASPGFNVGGMGVGGRRHAGLFMPTLPYANRVAGIEV
ncbi:hypothetical protein BDI4_660059 [Burkholderia diffusa]|nr:hypothetical protein BDI4_660059 [Burkholderia diffusa]